MISKFITQINDTVSCRLGLASVIAVFFQVHVSLSRGVINLNLADPLAVSALFLVCMQFITTGKLPVWKVDNLNNGITVLTVTMILAFINGYMTIGLTQWALGGRLLGWLVLLGYLSAGYLAIRSKNAFNLKTLSKIMVITLMCIILTHIILRLFNSWGLDTGIAISQNFEGFSANRNAFVFQLLMALCLYLACSCDDFFIDKNYIMPSTDEFFLAVLVVGIFWTGSRAGIGIVLLILVTAWYLRHSVRSLLAKSVVWAILMWAAIPVLVYIPNFIDWLIGYLKYITHQGSLPHVLVIDSGFLVTQSNISDEASNHERLATFKYAIGMWSEHALLGAGLGVFIAKSVAWFSHPQVVHNTILWILAEFGLIGIFIFGWFFYLISKPIAESNKRLTNENFALAMVLMVFFIFGLVHEVFYQRVFWLVLGLLIAKPFGENLNMEDSNGSQS